MVVVSLFVVNKGTAGQEVGSAGWGHRGAGGGYARPSVAPAPAPGRDLLCARSQVSRYGGYRYVSGNDH